MPEESPPLSPNVKQRKPEADPIVISGISGRYPESANVEEFWNQLISGKELSSIDDRRWPVG
jgi:acyl transferase domain-containing protein